MSVEQQVAVLKLTSFALLAILALSGYCIRRLMVRVRRRDGTIRHQQAAIRGIQQQVARLLQSIRQRGD